MYEQFFQLTRKPFDLLPNPDFMFMSRSHNRALSYLDYGIRERVGFILLTGEVGSGKTTIIRNLIKKNLGKVVLSKIFNTKVDSEQLLAMINDDFGLPVQNRNKIALLHDLNAFLIDQFVKGNQPVLIIDEAQNLANELLEEIRMLSNLETDSTKLLQIILVGQPELRQTIASPSMVQLRQRISINCHIQPLALDETEQYVLHRMEKAGNRNAVNFSKETLQLIFAHSRGIPRLINIICDFILLAAFAEETHAIDAPMVQEIIDDLDFEGHFWGGESSSGKEPEGGGQGKSSISMRTVKTFSLMLREMNRRLEKLEKENDTSGRQLLQELRTRVLAVEGAVKTHQEKTVSVIADMQKNICSQVKSQVQKPVQEEGAIAQLCGAFGRILRYRF